MIRKYLAMLRLGWLDAMAYRTEFFVSLIGWSIRLFIALFLWKAIVLARGGPIGTYNFTTIMQYFFLIQIIASFIFSRVGFDIAMDIYRGDFANFLLKPLNYLAFRLMHEVSKNVFRTALGIAIFGSLVIVFLGGIPLPLWKVPLAIISMVGAYLVNFGITALIAITAFWIVSSTRLMYVYFGMLSIFSGMVVPLDLFPPAYQTIFTSLPFAAIFYTPVHLLQAGVFAPELLYSVGLQWLYAFIALGILAIVYRRGVKQFEAVGR